ncbi:uncharacterized protein DNG_10347 [Cephalotrichum gorgonifer]|uniref:Uncharacterized protein n=1 Tax=Cephalotrichum gorgonifer TaxID=2041049 RepID=A0AAE8T0M0_9PEZI|nr:uncharacterized protein DNG_10347 [Cephalotrichum gorgonifer]
MALTLPPTSSAIIPTDTSFKHRVRVVGPSTPSPSILTKPHPEPALRDPRPTETENRPTFFSLPPEIRLQIYRHILQASPIRYRQPTPCSPCPPLPKPHHLEPIPADHSLDPDQPPPARKPKQQPRLLPAYRPFSVIPARLLLASRQIHEESHLLPFHANEFAFSNWPYSSALSTALALTRSLTPRQRSAVRYARLDLGAAALLSGTGRSADNWAALCALWSGLRGLRLQVALDSARLDDLYRSRDEAGAAELLAGSLASGLGRARALEQVEVELVSDVWSDRARTRTCSVLEKMLSEAEGMEGKVWVYAVRRVRGQAAGVGKNEGEDADGATARAN